MGRLAYESHATALDRNELGAFLVAVGLGSPDEYALVSLLPLNGLRVSESRQRWHIKLSGRGWWLGAVGEPAKEPKGALAQSLTSEQCDRDHREGHRNFGDGDDLTEQRIKHADNHGSAQRGDAGNSWPPRHAFTRRRQAGMLTAFVAARRERSWLTCGKVLHILIYCPGGTLVGDARGRCRPRGRSAGRR